jgi:hypothetical protein
MAAVLSLANTAKTRGGEKTSYIETWSYQGLNPICKEPEVEHGAEK